MLNDTKKKTRFDQFRKWLYKHPALVEQDVPESIKNHRIFIVPGGYKRLHIKEIPEKYKGLLVDKVEEQENTKECTDV